MKILIINGEEQLVKDITFCLQVRYPDIAIITSREGLPGLDILEHELPNVVFLGSSLPDVSILDMIKKIRELSDVALFVMSEGQNELRQAELLEAGVDEFINKQFSPIEFLAKVTSLLRRTYGLGFKQQRTFSIGDRLSINFSTREVLCSGKNLHLTRTEFNLLSELVRNEGNVLTHRMLLEKIWGSEYSDEPSFLKKYIYRLRSKIEYDSTNPQMIMNERGVGYRFVKNTILPPVG